MIIFKNEQAKALVAGWFERFRARIKTPTQSRTLKTSFGDTHLLVGGPPEAPPLVILHGAMASSAHALHELEPLLKQFRVYAVDVLGQSVMSADHRISVSNDEYGRWLAEVMDALALPRANVLGISWGGFVAIRLAAFAPARIDRLVLLVPAGMVGGPAWAGFVKMGLPMAIYLAFPSPTRLRKFVQNLLTTYDDDWMPYLGDAFRSYKMNFKIPVVAKPEELKALAAPTLVIAAENDVSFPGRQLIARAEQLFPKLEGKELIPDCNHCPPTTDAFRTWVSTRISTFLTDA